MILGCPMLLNMSHYTIIIKFVWTGPHPSPTKELNTLTSLKTICIMHIRCALPKSCTALVSSMPVNYLQRNSKTLHIFTAVVTPWWYPRPILTAVGMYYPPISNITQTSHTTLYAPHSHGRTPGCTLTLTMHFAWPEGPNNILAGSLSDRGVLMMSL